MQPGDFKYLTMNFSIDLPGEIFGTFLIAPLLRTEGLEMLHNTNTVGRKSDFNYSTKTITKNQHKQGRQTCHFHDNE